MKLLYLLIILFVSCEPPEKEIDLTIHYQTFGEGTPIVILNGGPGMSSEGFVPLAILLAKNHQSIIFDQRGTGKSILKNINRNTVTMDLMVADMERLRQKLGFEKWIVMGHSFGGMLSAYYATKHPDRIKAMILSSAGGLDLGLFSYLDINARLTEEQQKQVNHWARKISRGDTTYQARLQRGLNLAPAYLYDKSHVPAIAERLTQVNLKVNGLVFRDMQSIGFDCKEKLKTFQQPTLIIQGEEDIIDKKTANKIAEVLPNDELIFIEKCGHYGWLEQEESYLGVIETFLAKIKGS